MQTISSSEDIKELREVPGAPFILTEELISSVESKQDEKSGNEIVPQNIIIYLEKPDPLLPVLSASIRLNSSMSSSRHFGEIMVPDGLVVSAEEICELNRINEHNKQTYVINLNEYIDVLSNEELINRLNELKFPEENEDRYIGEYKVPKEYYDMLKIQMNFEGVKEHNEVLYGCAVRRTSIRTFPTLDVSLGEPNDVEFDLFQESVLQVAEPVRILHKSLDQNWYFIQTCNCIGWVSSKDIGIAISKEQWRNYIYPNDFLIITADKIKLGDNSHSPEISQLDLYMGTKIPIATDGISVSRDTQTISRNYVVKIPTRDISGNLISKKLLYLKGVIYLLVILNAREKIY